MTDTLSGRVILEVCVSSIDDAVVAQANGADRLELNQSLELGGLTPSIGLMEEVRDCVSIPVIAMVRPRASGFRYSAADQRSMIRDVKRLLQVGADGVAIGSLVNGDHPDGNFVSTVRQIVADRQLVFHRAFDLVADPPSVLEQLIDLGIDRILTSGGAPSAWQGRETIARLRERAGQRMEVLPGAGISAENVIALIEATGCDQVHGTFQTLKQDFAGFVADPNYPATCPSRVAATRRALDQIAFQ